MSKKKRNKDSVIKRLPFNIMLVPGFLVFALVPVVMRFYAGITAYPEHSWGYGSQNYTDLFLHGKVVVFAVLATVMAVLLVIKFAGMKKAERLELLKRFWPMLVYILFIILSTIFSMDRHASIHGEMEQMEPFFVLLGYVIAVCYTFLYVKDDKDVSFINMGILIGGFIVSAIGIVQMFGFNPFDTKVGKWLMIPASVRDYAEFKGNFNYIVSTLFNKDYVGPFVMIYFPICFSIIFSKTRLWQRISAGVISAMLFVFLLGSRSKTGIVVFGLIAVLMFIVLIRPIIRYWYLIVGVLVIGVGFFAFYVTQRDTGYLTRLRNALKVEKADFPFKIIDTTGDCVLINYKGREIKITYEVNDQYMILYSLDVFDNGELCEITETKNPEVMRLILSDGEKASITLGLIDGKYLSMAFKMSNKSVTFTKTGSNYCVFTKWNKRIESYESWKPLEGYEKIVSGRGGIWRLAIPRLMDHIFIGAGPDCFPNATYALGNDYAVMIRGSGKTVPVRPHNYFIQMGMNTGLLSLLTCLIFFVWYIADCFKLYCFKKPNGSLFYIGAGCMAAVIGFLGTGLANDSMIVVSPAFWVALGLGMAVNRMNKKI